MRVGLFIGTETFGWKVADFQAAAQRAKRLGVDTLFIKIADGGEIWYSGYAGIDTMLHAVQAEGVAVIPYLFSYANAFQAYVQEITIVNTLLSKGYQVCMDMESAWNGNVAAALNLVKDLHAKIWVSTWADPAPNFQNWLAVLGALAPKTIAFLPQVYTPFLQGVWQAQFSMANIAATQIIPTFNIPTLNAAQGLATVTLWEYNELSDAQISQVVASLGGISAMPLILSPTGCVLDLPKSFQLDNANNESQDMCGPWSVAELKYAGLPGKGASGTAQNVDDWAEAAYIKYIGPNVMSDQAGSSIDNMHQFLKDAGLHWFDIVAISPGSTQSSDLANLHKALDAGYPVLVTVNELSVKRRDGSNPYPWQPQMGPANHVFTLVGHTKDGYLLVDDELNQNDAWPDQYAEASIECHWACIVQVTGPDAAKPWLKPIPDPATMWVAGFNAQNFAVAPLPVPVPTSDHFAQETMDCWNSVYANLQKFAEALKLPMLNFSFAPPTGTDIHRDWIDAWSKGHQFGPPLTFEYDSTTKDGVKIKAQEFSHARAERAAGKTRWYTPLGEVLVP